MKKVKYLTIFIALITAISLQPTHAQGLYVQNMIGKNISSVISKYGKPAHQDRTNPAMECAFYKSKNYQMVFVANKKGVFQIEGWQSYKNKTSALTTIKNLISKYKKNKFRVDTVNVAEYNIYKKIINLNISLFENPYSKKYDVKIKANRNES